MEVIALRKYEPVDEALAERGLRKLLVLSERWLQFYPADQHVSILGHIGERARICRSGSVVPAESIFCKEDAARRTEKLGP